MRKEGQRICTEMDACKTGDVSWRSSPEFPLPDSVQEQVPSGGEGDGDAAECSQAVSPAPTRWCGKTGLCKK